MKLLSFFFIAFIFLTVALPETAYSQIDEQCPHIRPLSPRGSRTDDSERSIREQLIKLCIKENKKEFEELLERTEDIARLGDEISSSYETNHRLVPEDFEKLEKLESLLKKVRNELRASDDDEDEESAPGSPMEAVQILREQTGNFLIEIKKTTRHSVSVAAVRGSNALLRIVKFLRLNN